MCEFLISEHHAAQAYTPSQLAKWYLLATERIERQMIVAASWQRSAYWSKAKDWEKDVKRNTG